MKTLEEYIFEAKSFSQVKQDILKALKITSWDKGDMRNGIFPKLNIYSVKKQNKMNSVPKWLANIYNDNYDKIVIDPNFSYLNKSDYEAKVLNSFDKLCSIPGCSYQIINNTEEFKEITRSDHDIEGYPKVVISVPKEGDSPELPGIPEGNEDNFPKTSKPTEENKDKKIKFWCTGAGSMSVDYIAYGAMNDEWKPNFDRIQKRIGENKFTHYYTKLATKQFASYKALFNYLKKKWDNKYSEFSMVDEEKLIEASYDGTYYIKAF